MFKITIFMDKSTKQSENMAEGIKYTRQSYFRFDNIDDKSVSILVNSCGEVVEKDNFQTRMDEGRRDFYLMYMLEGKLKTIIDGQDGILERGSAICISPGTPYFYTNLPNETTRYRWVHFTGNGVDKVLSSCQIPLNQIMRVDVKESVISLWDELFYEFRNNATNFDGVGAIILPYVLMNIAKSRTKTESVERKLDLSIHYIHTHLAEQLSVEQLASMEFLSPSRYREVFKKVTGHSPSEYITLTRLKQAAEIFADGHSTIEETAIAVGYTDRLYFQRIFKKHMGITPGAYIKMLKG